MVNAVKHDYSQQLRIGLLMGAMLYERGSA